MTDQNIANPEQLVAVFNAKIGDAITQACDARVLHLYLQNGDKFAGWIKARIEKYEFQENQDFICVSENTETQRKDGQHGIVKRTEYHLTLDMAKELAMVENNNRGREARRYFIRMERLALEAAPAPVFKMGRHFADLILPDFTNPATAARAWADMAQTHADTAQAQANKARAWADAYERSAGTRTQSPSPHIKPIAGLLPPREAAFIQAWWDCLGSQTVTSTDLYRAVATKQCQELNNSSSALLGEISQWTPKKLSHALRRWSQSVIASYSVLNIGKSSHGLLWRLELLSA